MRLILVFLLFPVLSHADEPSVSIVGNAVIVECNGQTFKRSMNDSTAELWDWIREVCQMDQKETK